MLFRRREEEKFPNKILSYFSIIVEFLLIFTAPILKLDGGNFPRILVGFYQ